MGIFCSIPFFFSTTSSFVSRARKPLFTLVDSLWLVMREWFGALFFYFFSSLAGYLFCFVRSLHIYDTLRDFSFVQDPSVRE
jgi:hypothetical protein